MDKEPPPECASQRTRRATGSYRAADAKRAVIVEAAGRLFAERGFHRASLADIASEAESSQTGLLHHFKDKNGLLLAVLRWHDHSQAARFSPPKLGIRVLIGHILDMVAEEAGSPGVARLRTTIAAEATTPAHPAYEYFRNRYRLMEENNARAIQASIDNGELRPGLDAAVLGRSITAIGDGLKQQWLMSPSFDLVADVRGCFDALLRGISVDGRGVDA